MDYKKQISEKLGKEEILCQLAEESAELSQAALKLRRILSGKNPTPKTESEVKENLLEEIADIFLCIDCLMLTDDDAEDVKKIMDYKSKRWLNRLNRKDA